MRLPGVRGQPQPVRRPLLSDRHIVHRLRPGSGLPVPLGGVAVGDWLDRLGGDDGLPCRAWPRPRLCLEEGRARMGVMLDPAANPAPTEEALARLAGLTPGGPEMERFAEMRRELD